MHESVLGYVAQVVTQFDLAARPTLEVGSANINGSIRPLFHGRYIGIDHADGPGVDMVASSHHLPFPDNDFGVVAATEVFEHDPAFWLSGPEMARVLKPGGYLIYTGRGNGFGYHNPPDYWRATGGAAFRLIFDLSGLTTIDLQVDPQVPGVFGLARKP